MLSVSFNQDCSSLAVGTEHGYQLYTSKNVYKGQLDRIHNDAADKNTQIAERLFNSSLIAVVDRDHPCSLKICHFKKGSEICSYGYPNNILSVKLNRQRLVVCLADRYCIHNIRDMQQLHVILDTPANPTGLSALSIANDSALIAYPSRDQQGSLSIFDGIHMNHVLDIDAHDSPLAAIAFSCKADMVATASVKGTVIRTFSTSSGQKLHELRRGMKRCVTISSLAFSQDGIFLAASSNTETVHIFNLCLTKEETETGGWVDYLSSAVTASAASLMPSTVCNAFSAWRAFATARLTTEGKQTVTGIAAVKGSTYVVIADTNGLVHIFKLDVDNGGECELINTKRLDVSGCDEELDEKFLDSYLTVSTDSFLSDQNVGDATYAYKVKREKKDGPCTPSQQLNEIVDNVAACDSEKEGQGTLENVINLDDSEEFPPMS